MEKQDNLTPAILDLRRFREQLAAFLSEAAEMPYEIRKHCEKNCWNDSVADDIQHAMFELGHCLATLVMWEHDVELTSEQLRKINGIAGGERK